MANYINNIHHPTTPGTITPTDINAALTGDNATLFNQLNPIDSAKVRCQNNTKNQNQPKLLTITPTHQHETPHQVTPTTDYNHKARPEQS